MEYIDSGKKIDLAILDIQFEEEYTDGYVNEPIIKLIKKLDECHPECQILIMSKYRTHPNFTNSYPIDELTGRSFFAISRDFLAVPRYEYDKAFYEVLEKRLRILVSKLDHNELSKLLKYIKNPASLNEKAKNNLEKTLGVKLDTLFIHYDASDMKNKTKINNLTKLIMDYPNFSNTKGSHKKYWLQGDSKREYGFRDYYYQYYEDLYLHEKYSLKTLIKGALDCSEKLISDLVNKTVNIHETKVCIRRYKESKIRLDLLAKKVDNRIPNLEMLNFVDFLRKRLLYIGMYFGANLSAVSMSLLLQGNSYSNDKSGNLTKQMMTYLRFPIEDQLSTQNDNLIENCKSGERVRNKNRETDYNKNELEYFIPYQRNYEIIYKSLANYEREFCSKVCEFALNLNLAEEHKEHVMYIFDFINNQNS